MTYQRHVIFFFVFVFIAKEVSSWTIDLPEVRRYLFEKNEKYKTASHREGKTEYEDYITNDKRYYSNIQGNSMHNSDDRELHGDGNHEDHDKYADKYGYHDYMEKKVHSIVRDGSVYLEGLLGSLEVYTRFLQDCNRRDNSSYQNQSSWRPQFDFPSSANFTNSSATLQNFNSSNPPMMSNLTPNSMNNNQTSMNQNFNTNNQTFMGMNRTFMGMNRTFMGMNRTFMGMTRTSMSNRNYMRNYNMSCREAMNTSEQVRRYADLAMWATKRLQDLAYAKKYQQIDEREENELILKLAWFLDRLAYLTGFEPQPKLFLQQTRYTTTSPTTSPVPLTLVPSSPEQNQAYADCIRQESPIPATVRCQYVGAVPGPMQQFLDSLGTTTSTSPPSTEGFNVVGMSQDNVPSQTFELLITSDNTYPVSPTRTKRSPAEHEVHYPPDIKSKLANPHAIAEFIKKNIGKLKTVVKTVKSLKETTYKALLEDKDHHHHHHEFSYGSIPYLTIHKRSIDNTNSINNNDIPNPKNTVINLTVSDILTGNNERNEQSYDDKSVSQDNSVIKNENNDIPFITGITDSSYNHLPIIDTSVINNKSLKKRSIDNTVTWNHIRPIPVLKSHNRKKSIKKRAVNDPFSTLTNYYIKYKVWDSANPRNSNNNDQFTKNIDRFDVKNNLNVVVRRKKRALFSKQSIHIHLPKPIEHPHVHHEVSHKAKFLTHLHKIQQIAHKKIEKIHDLSHKKLEKTHAINHVKKELEHHIHKRSLHYQDLYLPRISENPQQDISFLVKNREGTNYNPSMTQAAEVRAGLEQAFSTGNILVIQRYGSNYNPANPNPFMAGVMKSMSDA